MAKQFLTPIDLTKNEIQNVALQSLASPPASPATGQIYLDTASGINHPTLWNAVAWVQLALRTVNTFLGKQTFAAPLDMGIDALRHFCIRGVAGGEIDSARIEQAFAIGAFARALAA